MSWSINVNYKSQVPNKLQLPKFQITNPLRSTFGIFNIVIWNLFDICNFGFGAFYDND